MWSRGSSIARVVRERKIEVRHFAMFLSLSFCGVLGLSWALRVLRGIRIVKSY